MKKSLLEFIRCLRCHGRLDVEQTAGDDGANGDRAADGGLRCATCHERYPIRDGIPRFVPDNGAAPDRPTVRTAARFGCLWSRSRPEDVVDGSYHFEKMAATLGLEEPIGIILDAGCGEGLDLARHAQRTGTESIGVELSDGGCQMSAHRVRHRPNAHVVQADLRLLPFADATFDRVYSYGVLHHVASPPIAAAELARVSRPGAEIAIYVYEDFAERAFGWRAALWLVNAWRGITTRLPPRLLYVMCQIASPIVYLLCTLPHRVLLHVPGLKPFARGLPFRHGRGPFTLVGDLYDRFSAPIERRYSRAAAAALLADAGLAVTDVKYERGWMVSARRCAPLPPEEEQLA